MANRTAIFIDYAYLDRHTWDLFNRTRFRVNFQAFSEKLAGDFDILRTYVYHCPVYQSNPPTDEERHQHAAQRRFFDALELLPKYEIKLGRLERWGPDANGRYRYQQKRVDIMLAVDLVQLAARQIIQEAIIVAGDSDFIPAIAAAKSEGVWVRLAHGVSPHRELLTAVDDRVELTTEWMSSVRLDSA